MKKWMILLLIAVLAALLLAGCSCDHEWEEADCRDPKTCAKCGVVEGEELGHDYQDANCESPKTCSRCGKEKGDPLGHTWVDATCAAPKTCSACGTAEGEALPHNWQAADCENPKTCADCGATEGEAAGHQWLTTTQCNAEITCSNCGASNGTNPDHVWVDADCENPKTCSTCGATEGVALGHVWVDATYERPKTCAVCRATEGEPLQPDQEPEIPLHLGVSYYDYAVQMDEILQSLGYYLVEAGEDGALICAVVDSATDTPLEIYVYFELFEDTDYVYSVTCYTEKGQEGNYAEITGNCFGAAWVVADPSYATSDMVEMMENYEVYDDGETWFFFEKNGLSFMMGVTADGTQLATIISPIGY